MIIRVNLLFMLLLVSVLAPDVLEASSIDFTKAYGLLDLYEPEPAVDTPEASFFTQESMKWVDAKQKEWSTDVVSLGLYIDGLMGDISSIQDANKSYLKIFLDADVSRFEDVELKPSIRFRLDLPLTKKRLRFIIESNTEQEQSIEERKLSELPSTVDTSNEDEGLYASFRYLFQADRWQRLSFDWGIKARFYPDFFARARAVRAWSLSDYWDMHFSQELFWFESKGLGTQTQFDFDRKISDSFLFRETTAIDWRERSETYNLLEQVAFFHNISGKRAVQYVLGVTAEHRKNHSVLSNYFGKATYRRRIYKDWLFYELTSGVEYPRSEDYQANPFVLFRFELLFSEDAGRKLSASMF